MLNKETENIILKDTGLKIGLENIEMVFSPKFSGIYSMADNRKYLIERGMTSEFADSLAKRYINRLESAKSAHICSIMDLFDSKKDQSRSLNAIIKAQSLEDVHFNYLTWGDYR